MPGFRSAIALAALAATLAFVAVSADAAPRMNAGSRGSRTYTAPPPTATSPNAARPIERSMTSPGQPGSTVRPATPAPATGGLFGGGMLGGLAAGFLGAGLFGMLMGHGFLGGMGGFASFLGLLLQVGLVILVARLAWAWWQRRSQPATAYASAASEPQAAGANAYAASHGTSSFFNGLRAAGSGTNPPIQIKPDDFDAFERTLTGVQTAYSNEDTAALRTLVTPEMLSDHAEELAANASRGVRNTISDVKLLQGDLAEAWSEGGDDYATVAMRYQQNDELVDRASGRLVEISNGPDEGVEYWTFRRAQGGPWMVSAIQQTG